MAIVRELGSDDYLAAATILTSARASPVSPEALRADDARAGRLSPRRWIATGGSGARTLAVLRPRPDGCGVLDFVAETEEDLRAVQASLDIVGAAAREMALGRILSTVGDPDGERVAVFSASGYRPTRRTAVLSLDPARASVAASKRLAKAAAYATRRGLTVKSMAQLAADPDRDRRVCRLDNALRQDVRGTEGWRWSLDEFREETYTPGFDPDRYLIALDGTGAYVGLLRIWMNPGGPKLGLIGVLQPYRRRGTATALIHRAIASWPSAEKRPLWATTDLDDRGTMRLATTVGFQTVRTVADMEKPVH